MERTILIHLNVEVPDGDERSVETIEAAVRGALEVGDDDDSVGGLTITVALAEEV